MHRLIQGVFSVAIPRDPITEGVQSPKRNATYLGSPLDSTTIEVEGCFGGYKVGPYDGHKWSYKPYKPISRVFSPQFPMYKAIYRAYNSTYNDRLRRPTL